MKLSSALLALSLATPTALADTAPTALAEAPPTEIKLGKAPSPPPRVDAAKVRAAERFLAARQAASIDTRRKGDARRLLAGSAKVDDATLYGAPGRRLVAFDFKDSAIEPAGAGKFRVAVYLLFADAEGRVLESRDEILAFSGEGGAYACTSLKSKNVMQWDSNEVAESAAALSAEGAVSRVEDFLKTWSKRQAGASAYSVENVYSAGRGTLLIPCLRFTAVYGKRGYEVVDSPMVLSRGGDGYRIDSN